MSTVKISEELHDLCVVFIKNFRMMKQDVVDEMSESLNGLVARECRTQLEISEDDGLIQSIYLGYNDQLGIQFDYFGDIKLIKECVK